MAFTPQEEYAEHFLHPLVPYPSPVDDVGDASKILQSYLRSRLIDIAKKHSRVVMMLSSGIDSMLAAYVFKDICLEYDTQLSAVTVSNTSTPEGLRESAIARGFASDIGIDHITIEAVGGKILEEHLQSRSIYSLDDTAEEISNRLSSINPWMIGAGVVFNLVTAEVSARYDLDHTTAASTAIVSASGADVLFCGGKDFSASTCPDDDWRDLRDAEIARCFSIDREIPDFYDRVFEIPVLHYKIWQTHSAVDLAYLIAPSAIRGGGENWHKKGQDKKIFYDMLDALYTPSPGGYMAEDHKIPMQKSSGIFSHLEQLGYKE